MTQQLKYILISLNRLKKSNLPDEVIIDFVKNHCPDHYCASGHKRGECIHMEECLEKFAQDGGWL
jgi:hypothetical protein